jgi:hypothetical protein
MLFKWIDERCIVCAKNAAQRALRCPDTAIFTKEHLIPEALGGRLICYFLCKHCNSSLGHQLEAHLKEDARIRMAIENLKDSLPNLWKSMTEGQHYVAKATNGLFKAKVRNGQIRLDTSTQADGSLICPSDQAPKKIRTNLERNGATQSEIAEALDHLEDIQEGSRVKVAKGLEVLKFTSIDLYPKLNSIGIEPCALLKIAYEYLALNFGKTIFHEYFDIVREGLRSGKLPACCLVEEMRTQNREYQPIHGIAGKTINSGLVVKIRIFGYLSYNVTFLKLSTKAPLNYYVLNLQSGDENWIEMESENKKLPAKAGG